MSNLTDSAPVAQIQEELSFHQFMLSTVDAEDEEAEERTAELNATIQHLQDLLDQKENAARPETLHSRSAPQPGSLTGSLPSRSRPHPAEVDDPLSPLAHHNRPAPSKEMERSSDISAVHGRNSSAGYLKRQSRGSMDLSHGQPFSKAPRQNYGANEPIGGDDFDASEFLVDSDEAPSGMSAFDTGFNKFLKEQRKIQEDLQREKEDRLMAQRLSNWGGALQACDRSTQSYLDHKGAYNPPPVPQKTRIPAQHQAVSTPMSNGQPRFSGVGQQSSHVSGTMSNEFPGSQKANVVHAQPTHLRGSSSLGVNSSVKLEPNGIKQPQPQAVTPYRPVAQSLDSSDSDSLVEITPAQFAQIPPARHHKVHPSMQRNARATPSTEPRIAQPASTPYGYAQYGYPTAIQGGLPQQTNYATYSVPMYYPSQNMMTTNWNNGINGYQQANGQGVSYPRIPDPSTHRSQYNVPTGNGWLENALNLGRDTLNNVGQWASTAWNNQLFHNQEEFEADSDLEELFSRKKTLDFNRKLHERGLTHMLNDPARDREELQKLIENIRPDEDLPEHLMQDTPPELAAPLMAHQKLGLAWLKKQEEGSNKGGILADDMGLGKTIQALALIVTRPSSDPAIKTTLIIAPVALLKQWQREIQNKIRRAHALRTYIFHGANKKKLNFAALCTYDVVLTTFGTVSSEHKRKEAWTLEKMANPDLPSENFPLLGDKSKWYRVIIDEAQCIKNKLTAAAKSATSLNATYRLCMSGTPMMNSVEEMYSLINFLRIPPYNDNTRFHKDFSALLKKVTNEEQQAKAMKAFQALLKAILLRRTKKSKIDGKPILQLKPRISEKVHAVFNEEQKEFYEMVEKRAQMKYNRYLQQGTVLKNYSHILTLLLRLRQCCDHPDLIKDQSLSGNNDTSGNEMKEFAKQLKPEVIKMIKETNGNFECPICYDASENPTIFFPCGHDVCSECFTRLTDRSQAIAEGDENGRARCLCPECREVVDTKKVFNYNIFKKVHEPENDDDNEHLSGLGSKDSNEESDSDSDSEDDSEDDSDSDADSQGDLRDFVVADDVEENEAAEPRVEDGELGDDEDAAEDSPESKAHQKPRPKGKGKTTTNKKMKTEKKKPKVTLAELKKQGMRNAAAKKRYLRRIRRDWQSSAKVDKVMEILRNIRDKKQGEKTLIFSLWTSMLDLLEVPIDDEGIKYRRYDGSMSAGLRDDAVADFNDKPDVTVMLVSLKAGNAGLNLTAASQVIILDPFWNPFTEEQAIDRAHRIGQTRDVHIHRILVAGTVEDRIEEIKDQKREVIEMALDEGAAKNLGRLNTTQLSYLFGIS